MLERYLDALLFELQGADDFLMALPLEDRASWDALSPEVRNRLKTRADGWLDKAVPVLSASAYISFSRAGIAAEYEKNYRLRREMLHDLVIGSCLVPDGRYDLKLADVIWAICEETSWILPRHNPASMTQRDLPLPDAFAHRVDSAAADTASDLALTVQMVGARLEKVSIQLIDRIEKECQRRVTQPFVRQGETGWLCGPRSESLRCLSGCTMAFLTFERDRERRWICMRKAWMMFDKLLAAMPSDGSVPGGLDDWADAAQPVMDMIMMILSGSRGRVDVRAEKQVQLLCHYPVFCHIAQNWFVNPGARSMRPVMSGRMLYRIGGYIQDEALCDLGVFLHRTCGENDTEERTLLHYAADIFNMEPLEEEPIKPPFRSQGYFNVMQMLVAHRTEDSERGLALAAYGGNNGALGSHADAGNFVLFCEGEPVLVDAGFIGDTAWHNLPVIGGAEQSLGTAYGAEDVSCRMEEDFAMLSMDLTRAYPPQVGIYNWQRTLIYERNANTVQLMEVFDLRKPQIVEFNFITPFEPVLGKGYAQLGPVRMRWEEDMEVDSHPFDVPAGEMRVLWGEKLFRLTLTCAEPLENGKLTFMFNALRTFG